MKELVFRILQEYAIWGTIIVTLIAVLILARMHRQLKKLNRNLGVITNNIQEYFDVIMTEEEEEAPKEPSNAIRREEVYLTREEREMLISQPKEEHGEEEAVFNAVLQEYFP